MGWLRNGSRSRMTSAMIASACFTTELLPLHSFAGLERPDVSARKISQQFDKLFGPAGERWECPEVQRNHAAHIQHPACERGLAWTHGVEIADRKERQLGMIQAFDELH